MQRQETKRRRRTHELLDAADPGSVVGQGIECNIGLVMESISLCQWDKDLRGAGSRVRLIAGPDFSNCDFAMVDIQQKGVRYPFPDEEPFSSYEVLRWAKEHGNVLRCVLGDFKTGPPSAYFMQNDADLFFIQLSGMFPDRMYVIPRAHAVFLQDQAVTKRRTDGHDEMLFSKPAVAPYAVFEGEYVALFERVVLGATAASTAYRSPLLWPGPDVLRHGQVSLGNLFRFAQASQGDSFARVWKLYQSLRRADPTIRFERVVTQPLGGDFVIRIGERPFTIQHKTGYDSFLRSDMAGWWEPPCHFHYLFHDVAGRLHVYCTPEDRHAFEYNTTDMRNLASFLVDYAPVANSRLHAATSCLLTKPPPSSTERPLATPVNSGQATQQETSSYRKMAQRLALQVRDLVNLDKEHLDLPLAALYLNWDQTHPEGEMFLGHYDWTPDERKRLRDTKQHPSPLEHASYLSVEGRRGVLLRFCCRNYHNRELHSQHFPLQQQSAELPTTDQPYFLICAPDATMVDKLPSSLQLVPSEFIEFPKTVHDEWDKSKRNKQNGPDELYKLTMLYGHMVETQEPWEKGIGVEPLDLWVTPKSLVQQLHKVVQGVGTMSVTPAESRLPQKQFETGNYLTEARKVLRAPLNLGLLKYGDSGEYRDTGYLKVHNAKGRDRVERNRSWGLDPSTPGARKGKKVWQPAPSSNPIQKDSSDGEEYFADEEVVDSDEKRKVNKGGVKKEVSTEADKKEASMEQADEKDAMKEDGAFEKRTLRTRKKKIYTEEIADSFDEEDSLDGKKKDRARKNRKLSTREVADSFDEEDYSFDEKDKYVPDEEETSEEAEEDLIEEEDLTEEREQLGEDQC